MFIPSLSLVFAIKETGAPPSFGLPLEGVLIVQVIRGTPLDLKWPATWVCVVPKGSLNGPLNLGSVTMVSFLAGYPSYDG